MNGADESSVLTELSPAEAVKAMRLARCEELRAGLEPIRMSLDVFSQQLVEVNEGTARLERGLTEALTFSAIDIQVAKHTTSHA